MPTSDDSDATIAKSSPPGPSPTLLPSPVARAVSLATRSTGLALRVGSFIGSYSLDAARFTTLSSLELARGMVEGVLSRAGGDVVARSASGVAASDAETVLERSLEGLHFAVVSVVFWTSASFQLTSTTLSAASDVSQLMLSSLDQLFGSTDSSRAIASIVTLIRREFRHPATGAHVDKVGVVDLILALSALAYLQRRCRRSVAEEARRKASEEVIWDVVVLSDGERVDVGEDGLAVDAGRAPAGADHKPLSSSLSRPTSSWHVASDEDETVSQLKSLITPSVLPGTLVSVSNSVTAVQTITVEIRGPEPVSLPTLPGADIVEVSPANYLPLEQQSAQTEAVYKVVYKIERNKTQSTSFQHGEERSGPLDLDDNDHSPALPPRLNHLQAVDSGTKALESAEMKSKSAGGDASGRPVKQPEVTITPDSPLSEQRGDNTANQKKQRSSLQKSTSREKLTKSRHEPLTSSAKKRSENAPSNKLTDRKAGFRQVIRGRGQSLSNMLNKESAVTGNGSLTTKPRPQWKTPGATAPSSNLSKSKSSSLRRSPDGQARQDSENRLSRQTREAVPRSTSRASYVSVHGRRRNSIISQTDSFSIRSTESSRPSSPALVRGDFAGQGAIVPENLSSWRAHPRAGARAPSLYSLATNDSQASVVLSSYYQKSAFNATDALDTLRREGFVDGTFPSGHLLQNITRYMRYSSASYGSHFLKLLGISKEMPNPGARDSTHQDVRHFIHHTESGASNILLASFVDPQGGSDSSGSTGTGLPLVHYISLDHEAKAVILSCRGTLGFEDVLTDMTCDYDTLVWRGRSYQVHKGVHASARRLLYGGDGRVLITLKEALNEFPDYGLVLCGHSLGAAVTAILGVMLSEPNPDGNGFVTANDPHPRLLPDSSSASKTYSDVILPAGRRIHVYAYGSPGVMSRSLCRITRGLITSVIHGNDLVPHLSLGLLHDFQAMASAFKNEENKAKAEIRHRMWSAFHGGLADKWHGNGSSSTESEEKWMLPVLDALRATMKNKKLMPPGEVFTIESQRVLRRDAFLLVDEGHVGRPAQRIVLKYIKDVEAHFGEVRFGTSMLIDHSPAKYEDALNKLRLGVGA